MTTIEIQRPAPRTGRRRWDDTRTAPRSVADIRAQLKAERAERGENTLDIPGQVYPAHEHPGSWLRHRALQRTRARLLGSMGEAVERNVLVRAARRVASFARQVLLAFIVIMLAVANTALLDSTAEILLYGGGR